MIFIAHRGNMDGPNPEMENRPEYIQLALNKGYDVEVDLWVFDDTPYSGHDSLQYRLGAELILNHSQYIWFHCKNPMAVKYCVERNLHWFWHQTDNYTLTSCGFVWVYPGKNDFIPRSIRVMPEWDGVDKWEQVAHCAGICTDYLNDFVELRNEYNA